MSRCLHAFALILALSFAPDAVQAQSHDTGIDRLMALFQVREMTVVAIGEVTNEPGFQALPAEQRGCLARVLTGDALFVEMRTHYRELFADPAIMDETLAFFGSPVGSKLLGVLLAQAKGTDSGTDPLKSLNATETAALDQFIARPAGQLFVEMPTQLPALQAASVQKLVSLAVRGCGQPSKS